jgi:colanic acid biosynthesis glycosyl transferase WcaI
MNVLITTQVYPPELHPSALMVSQLARFLAGRGHEVTVACGHPHHPTGHLPAGWSRRLLQHEEHGGVRVLRGWHVVSPSRRIGARALVWLSQALGTAGAALAARAPDVVISYGPPLAGPLFAAALARRARARLLTVVYDLYPDVAIESGSVRNPLVIAAAKRAERAQYALSDRILVLSEGFRRTLERKGVGPEKILTIPVWLEAAEITPTDRDTAWRRRQGIGPELQVILYAGTIGLVSGAHVVLEAADRLRQRREIAFLFVGDGAIRADLERSARAARLENVRFLPFQPREAVSDVQASADVSLVTLAPGRGRTSVPSKVLGYMAAGRPVVASVDPDCDTADTIISSQCGVVVRPGDADALADAVSGLVANPALRRRMGEHGRRAFERGFAAEAVLRRYAEAVEELGIRSS